jgi:serralysin
MAFSSGIYYIDALHPGYAWNSAAGSSLSLNYSFGILPSGGAFMFDSEQDASLAALQEWLNVANITIREATASEENSQNVDLTFGVDELGDGVAGLTYTFFDTTIYGADVLIDDDQTGYSAGGEAYLTLIHEIGHALGLKHPAAYGNGDTPPYLPAAEDTGDVTVMSYNLGTYGTDENWPVTPMIYDIAAIQYLYGANTGYHAGTTTYSFDGSKTVKTIWDGGGEDVLMSTYSGNVTIDLREGASYITHIGNAHLWNAFGANIEQGVAGVGNDTLHGNSLNNTLYGSTGADAIVGYSGADLVYGGSPTGTTDSADTLYGGNGIDTVYGNQGADLIYGGSGAGDTADVGDQLFGGKGTDVVYGNSGGDAIYGGGGSDTLYGGVDADTIIGGNGAGDLTDLLDVIYGNLGNDVLYGNTGGDSIFGGQGADSIFAGIENDYVNGGLDNDQLTGGTGDDTFHFLSGSGMDTILDFTGAGVAGGDVIALASGINGLASSGTVLAVISITYSGDDALVNLGSGHSISVLDVGANTLTEGDFIWA